MRNASSMILKNRKEKFFHSGKALANVPENDSIRLTLSEQRKLEGECTVQVYRCRSEQISTPQFFTFLLSFTIPACSRYRILVNQCRNPGPYPLPTSGHACIQRQGNVRGLVTSKRHHWAVRQHRSSTWLEIDQAKSPCMLWRCGPPSRTGS